MAFLTACREVHQEVSDATKNIVSQNGELACIYSTYI